MNNDWIKERERVLKLARESGDHDPELQNRRSGRSTGLALIIIGDALSNPNNCFTIKDHFPNRMMADRHLMELTKKIINELGLVGFVFNNNNLTICFNLPKITFTSS